MNNPLISIIAVNYRNENVTCELLQSLSNLSYENIEVIVVDNGMQYDSSLAFESAFPGVIVLKSEQNLGFAGGNNLALKVAKGDFVFLLNNDTEVPQNLMENMLKHFTEENIAAISPNIRYYDNPGLIQYAGFTRIDPLMGRNKMIREFNAEHRSHITPYFHGAAVMIRKSAISNVGLMPENYFLYYEEIDWSNAFTKAGYEIRVANDVSILHKESISTGKESPLKAYFLNRNRLLFMMRNHPIWTFIPFLFIYILLILPKEVLKHIVKKEVLHIKAIVLGIIDFSIGKMRLSMN